MERTVLITVERQFSTAVFYFGPVVKRLRHRPFTAVTRVRFPSGSYYGSVPKWL